MRQEFDYAGLEGRLLSSSYAPGPEHPKHRPMLHELRRIFDSAPDADAWASTTRREFILDKLK